jgi:hypothetical protein
VAHEAIFRRWGKLREWIAAEREFLAWRSGLEAARRAWQTAPDRSKRDALLMGLALAQAQSWFAKRSEDLPEADRGFIALSRKMAQQRRLRAQALVGGLVALVGLLAVGLVYREPIRQSALGQYHWRMAMGPSVLTMINSAAFELALQPHPSPTRWAHRALADQFDAGRVQGSDKLHQ